MKELSRILIYESSLDGHRLEYIHHLYCYCVESKYSYVFSLPHSFNEVKTMMEWPANPGNISFSFFDNSEIEKSKNIFQLSYRKARSIIRESIINKTNNVFLISFLEIFPLFYFMAFFTKIRVSGIIYKIYLYKWQSYSIVRKIIIFLLYFLIRISRNVFKCFVLNDATATIYLNKIWKTDKFVYLPDPINTSQPYVVRNTPMMNKVRFLHFGALTRRKGTINILKAIGISDPSHLSNFEFIFAGKLYEDIHDDFWGLVNLNRNKTSIIVKDYFLNYDELDGLCAECDVLLAPYDNTDSSSGVVSYAAKYNKPVVVPNSGLLSKLVKKNHLGICIKNNSEECLCDYFQHFRPLVINTKNSKEYLKKNSIKNFCIVIFSTLAKN